MYVNTGVEYLLKLNKENNPVICCESSRIFESTVTQIVVIPPSTNLYNIS